MSDPAARDGPALDVRLVPAALIGWLTSAVGILTPAGPALTALCALVAASAALARRRLPAPVVTAVLAAGVVGVGFGAAIMMRNNMIREHPLAARYGAAADVTVTPSENPHPLGNGRLMFRANLNRLGPQGSGGMVVVFASGTAFGDVTAGRPLRFRARVARPRHRDLTVAALTAVGDPAFGTASPVQRLAGVVRGRFAAVTRETLPAGPATILPGLVLGDTSDVSPPVTAQFKAAGLTHLMAVSGANVTIVCGAALLAAMFIGPRAAVLLAAVALLAFVVVVQPTASVLRAALMGGLSLLAVLTVRRRQAVPALAGTVLAVLTVAPQLAVDAGFALSVSATAALVVIAPAWSARLTDRGWPKPLADAVSVSAAAQLVTAPLIAGISGRFSLVAVAANLAAAPVIAPITVLGTAAAAVSTWWSAGAALLIRFCGPAVWWLLTVARWAAAAPGATIPVPVGAAGVVVVGLAGVAVTVLWRTRWRRAMIGAAGLGVAAWVVTDMSAARDTIVG